MPIVNIKVNVPADDTSGILGNITDAQISRAIAARLAGNEVVFSGRQGWTVNQTTSVIDFIILNGLPATANSLGIAQIPSGAFVASDFGFASAISDIAPYVAALGTLAGITGGVNFLTNTVSSTLTTAATAADVVASQGVIASMTGAGIADAVIAESIAGAAASAGVASASVAVAEMGAAQWAVVSTGALAPSGAVVFAVEPVAPQPSIIEQMSAPLPEPVRVAQAPAPAPHPSIIEQMSAPLPEPVRVAQAPAPAPQPSIIEQMSAPLPEPARTVINTATKTITGVASSAAVSSLFAPDTLPDVPVVATPLPRNDGLNFGAILAALVGVVLAVSYV